MFFFFSFISYMQNADRWLAY